MICNNCGHECGDFEQFCPQCGAQLGMENSYSEAPAAKFISAFCNPLFMVGCILITVAAIPFGGNFDVLSILFAIFMWIVFAKAKNGECDFKSMRCISGTVFATEIILWILTGCFALLGLIAVFSNGLIMELFEEGFGEMFDFEGLMGIDFIGLGIIVILIALVVAIVCLVLLNVLVYRPAHKLAKSMYTSAESGYLALDRVGYVSTALLVVGILNAVVALGSLGNILSTLQSGSSAAALIVLAIWLKNNFVKAA